MYSKKLFPTDPEHQPKVYDPSEYEEKVSILLLERRMLNLPKVFEMMETFKFSDISGGKVAVHVLDSRPAVAAPLQRRPTGEHHTSGKLDFPQVQGNSQPVPEPSE